MNAPGSRSGITDGQRSVPRTVPPTTGSAFCGYSLPVGCVKRSYSRRAFEPSHAIENFRIAVASRRATLRHGLSGQRRGEMPGSGCPVNTVPQLPPIPRLRKPPMRIDPVAAAAQCDDGYLNTCTYGKSPAALSNPAECHGRWCRASD